jgi:sec-independent protein translocase protein TatA
MPNIGPMELVIVLVIVIIVFGVGRLPEIGGALGKGIREFRSSVKDEPASGSESTVNREKRGS